MDQAEASVVKSNEIVDKVMAEDVWIKDEPVCVMEEPVELKPFESLFLETEGVVKDEPGEFSYSVVEISSQEEPPGSKAECYSEGSDRLQSECLSLDGDMAHTSLYASVLVCALCNMVSTDCKCQQRSEVVCLFAKYDDISSVTGALPNSPSPQCRDKYTCDHCGKSYVLKNDLVQHLLMHGHKQTLHGNMTKKSLSNKSNLILHSRTLSVEHPYSCDVCRKSFSEKRNLIRHRIIHSGERPFSCDLCRKSFSQKCHLIRHSRTHSGERPFSCDLCSKSFSGESDLACHRRTHSWERPFSCDLCNKSFGHKSHLINHRRTHFGVRPFSCDLCSKPFSRKSNLIRHSRTHSGERLFSCDLCSKSFSEKSHFIRHRRTHFREAPL